MLMLAAVQEFGRLGVSAETLPVGYNQEQQRSSCYFNFLCYVLYVYCLRF